MIHHFFDSFSFDNYHLVVTITEYKINPMPVIVKYKFNNTEGNRHIVQNRKTVSDIDHCLDAVRNALV